MPTLKYLGQSFDCAVAIKGADYIHLLDAAGVMTATFDGITDFSDYTLENGAYTDPTEEGYCKVAVVRDDGTIGEGTHTCADIGDGVAAKETVDAHVADETRHITAAERSNWNGKAAASHTHTKSQITDFPSSMPASDVYAWAKKSTKPTYTASEVGAAAASHTHTQAQITGLSTALESAGVWVPLMEHTVSSEVAQVNLSVGSLGLRNYRRVIVIPQIIVDGSYNCSFRINNLTTGVYYNQGSYRTYTTSFHPWSGHNGGLQNSSTVVELDLSGQNTTVALISCAGGAYNTWGCVIPSSELAPSAVTAVNFHTFTDSQLTTVSAIQPGSKFKIYGLK